MTGRGGGVENVYTQKFYTKTTYITLLSEKFEESGAPLRPFYTSPQPLFSISFSLYALSLLREL
ncbi:hypothetical protein Hdeb2414_s0009g00312221 [Helianthus debilis subsp. tardiflorus]